MMTRKDYVATAQILNDYKHLIDSRVFQHIITDFMMMFEDDNPRFDADRFFDACDKESELV
jgi:hypothetical protein